MISMNCFLMKSSIAMSYALALSEIALCALALALLPRSGTLLDFGRGLRHFRFDPVQRQRSRSERTIREHQGRRRVDMVLLAEERRLRDRRRAVAVVVRQFSRVE